ncbi:hypothetical protein [Jannaschia donghaensis]|uniref:Uncharacterized protein n=1 Tax=Jannaschia donghaensis TaxID=420998 RepID=A0A0M6YN39_9RHOB|nr:hypothetical protein [Jannaschia donghaensis]CTQ50943.1 hypothetical protein JDO7802_02974 [Jannaschia donghaensis]
MKYYVNTEAKESGTHVVHAESCQFLPGEDKRKALGDAAKCETALDRARDEYSNVDGCGTCCSDCSGN